MQQQRFEREQLPALSTMAVILKKLQPGFQRLDLLEEFCELFPEAQVTSLAADREFLGKDWFTYCLEQALIEFQRLVLGT